MNEKSVIDDSTVSGIVEFIDSADLNGVSLYEYFQSVWKKHHDCVGGISAFVSLGCEDSILRQRLAFADLSRVASQNLNRLEKIFVSGSDQFKEVSLPMVRTTRRVFTPHSSFDLTDVFSKMNTAPVCLVYASAGSCEIDAESFQSWREYHSSSIPGAKKPIVVVRDFLLKERFVEICDGLVFLGTDDSDLTRSYLNRVFEGFKDVGQLAPKIQ
tara:strand:+ start:1493 stop:2134 length:642 start_codon:yes stop_codon:yes gene_type:complete